MTKDDVDVLAEEIRKSNKALEELREMLRKDRENELRYFGEIPL